MLPCWLSRHPSQYPWLTGCQYPRLTGRQYPWLTGRQYLAHRPSVPQAHRPPVPHMRDSSGRRVPVLASKSAGSWPPARAADLSGYYERTPPPAMGPRASVSRPCLAYNLLSSRRPGLAPPAALLGPTALALTALPSPPVPIPTRARTSAMGRLRHWPWRASVLVPDPRKERQTCPATTSELRPSGGTESERVSPVSRLQPP